MEFAEFEVLAGPLRRKSAAHQVEFGFALIEGHTVSAEDIANVERDMAVVLPDTYKTFMMRYGGGAFGFVDLCPLAPVSGWDDLRTLNDREFPDRSFVAVAPVGTGDHWGFPVTDGRCHEQVWFRCHDAGNDELVAHDFLDFVTSCGLDQ